MKDNVYDITSGRKNDTMFNSVLKIFNVGATNGGVYTCTAAIGTQSPPMSDTKEVCVKGKKIYYHKITQYTGILPCCKF